jgi:hypothetical protein
LLLYSRLQAWRPWPSSFFLLPPLLGCNCFRIFATASCLRANTKVVTNIRKKVIERHSIVIRSFFSYPLFLSFFSRFTFSILFFRKKWRKKRYWEDNICSIPALRKITSNKTIDIHRKIVKERRNVWINPYIK